MAGTNQLESMKVAGRVWTTGKGREFKSVMSSGEKVLHKSNRMLSKLTYLVVGHRANVRIRVAEILQQTKKDDVHLLVIRDPSKNN